MERKCDGIRIVGVTGGIGSGKSVVCRILSLRGFRVYDCDSRARELMHSPQMAQALKEIIGERVFDTEGKLDRGYLASMIFSDKTLLQKVNALVHAAVREDVNSCASQSGNELLFVESAIHATSGLADMTDVVWLVNSPLNVRIERVRLRNPNLSDEEIVRRIEAQKRECTLTDKYYLRIIDNSGSVPLLPQIDELLSDIKRINI